MKFLNLEKLKEEIIKQYNEVLKLPKDEKNQLLQRLYLIIEIQKSNYRYEILSKYGHSKEAIHEIQKINGLMQELNQNSKANLEIEKHAAKINRETPNINVRIDQVISFMVNHIQNVGIEQAVKDFQYGLNILNNRRKNSTIEAFHQLKEDGDFGNKTYACLANICRHYSPRIICKSIQRGAVTNAIFDTKNNRSVNTEKKIQQIKNDLKLERAI